MNVLQSAPSSNLIRRNGDTERMPQLDALRAIAALMVLVQHTIGEAARSSGLLEIGTLGVWLFLVLSGFLITGILLRTLHGGVRAWRTFYARRLLRILPAYYLLVCAATIANVPGFRAGLPWHLLFVSNWWIFLHGPHAAGAAPLWSLGVEEQFYLLWPALLLLTPRRRLPLVLGIVVLVGVGTRALLVTHDVVNHASLAILMPTPACLDPLALGALLAWARWSGIPGDVRARLVQWAGALGMLLWIAAALLAPRPIATVLAITGASFACLLVVARTADGIPATSWVGRLLLSRPLRALGTISYAVYLWHRPIQYFVLGHTSPAMIAWSTTTFTGATVTFAWLTIVTILVASASWVLVERPLNRLKRFIPMEVAPSPSPPVVSRHIPNVADSGA